MWDNRWDDSANKLMVGLELLFPDSDTYEDYEVIANIVRENGIVEAKSCPNVAIKKDLYREGDQNSPIVNEWNDGKGLKGASYGIEIDDDVVSLSFNVVRKGALDGKNFGGVFTGSGKGIEYENLYEVQRDWASRRGGQY